MGKIQIKTLEIAGLRSVLEALRLPYGKECRSKTNAEFNIDKSGLIASGNFCCAISPKDLQLLSTLVKRGDEHSKCVRGLIVYAEINAPLSFWNEADTYRVGTDRLSSTSTMHTIGKGGISIDDFDVPDIIKEILSEPIKNDSTITPLFIESPKELKKVYKTYFDREYEIWNNGDIYSMPFDTEEILPNGSSRNRHFDKIKIKTGRTMNQQGYYQVRLGGRKGKTFLLHRILAECFVPKKEGCNVVNHINGNKGDCSISNLEWVTSSENNIHAFKTGLKEVTLKQRYLAFKRGHRWNEEDVENWVCLRSQGKTLQEIADMYDTAVGVVSKYTKDRYRYTSELSYWFSLAMKYENVIQTINELASLYEETDDFEYVIRIKEILPSSFMQKRIQMFSYQTLRRIYFQRRNHRLPMWHDFCSWISSLPFFDTLIGVNNEETK